MTRQTNCRGIDREGVAARGNKPPGSAGITLIKVLVRLVLATCATLASRAQTPLVVTRVSPVPSGVVSDADGVVIVTWTGGTAPFQVQTCSRLGDAWQDVAGITSAFSQTNITTASAGFYRVVSVAGTFSKRADTTPPSVPTGLTATAPSWNQINLSWNASTDTGKNATGVKGYNVYRNSIFLKQVFAPSTSTSDLTYYQPRTCRNVAGLEAQLSNVEIR